MRSYMGKSTGIGLAAQLLLAALIALLVGCGDTPSSATKAGAGTTTLTITLSPSNAITVNLGATVTATLTDATGAPMPNEVITFSTDPLQGALSATTALTNANGVASVVLSQAPTAGSGAAYVTVSSANPVLSASAGYSVAGGGGGGGGIVVGSISATATPASATADGYTLIAIKATVLDGKTSPITGQAVTFTTSAGILSSETAVTDASGVAQVFLTAPIIAGSANVIAYTGGVPASVRVTFVPGLPANIAISATPASVAASGTSTIVSTLTDYHGNNAGAGQTVTFGTSSATGGHFTDLAGVVTNSATTDQLGMARILYVAGTCAGSCTDFLTANATDAAKTKTYATNLFVLPVGGTSGAPTMVISPIASPIAAGAPATVTVTLKDAAATAVPYAVVTFKVADPTLATLTPTNGTALTNASGIATITLTAGISSSGASTLTAAAQVGSAAVTSSAGFSVGAASVTLSNMVFGVNPLSAFGTTSVAVTVGGVPATTPITVNFSSVCASSGKATVSSSAITVGGVATGSYRDNGCAGTDTVTATVSGSSLTGNLAVTPPAIGSLQYISASPTTIALKGIGGVETSQVTFKVVDAGGNPLSGQKVSFGLSTTIGGITLTPAGAPSTAISDNNGLVVITVNAGVVSTPVRVTATTGALSSQSSTLTITTGIPDQDSFSLSASTHNIEGWGYDGVTSELTARLADHFNNPVPDGTAVNFTTEGGSIVGSCTTVQGECKAVFTSQNPRPTNGRVTVLAYAVGEESFTDLSGNGLADTGEMIDANGNSTDKPEAYVDFNENGAREPGGVTPEPYLDFNVDGAYNAADTKFNGVLCSGSAICGTTKTIHVRQSQVLTLSSSSPDIGLFSDQAQTLPITSIDLQSCNSFSVGGGLPDNIAQPVKVFYLRVVDIHGNAMPAGTTINFAANNGTILSGSSFIVPDTSACNSKFADCPVSAGSLNLGLYPIQVRSDATYVVPIPPAVAGTCTNTNNGGALTVDITSPKGLKTGVAITVRD